MNELKIAIIQIRTEMEQDETLAKAERMIREAAQNDANLVALPEMFNCPYAHNYFRPCAEQGHAKTVAAMSRWAKENNLIIVGGSIPELDTDGKIYNTCFVYDENGNQIARHRKAHLFDVDLPQIRFRESATFTEGNEITVFDTKYGKMGVVICFDVRFPEMVRATAMRGAKIIFLPAQFNDMSGPEHWDMTVRMRAIDNELFVVGAGAALNPEIKYKAWGHSMVADPFGHALVSCDETEQIVYCDIDLDRVEQVRKELPTFMHLRRDLYPVAE